MPKPEVIFPKGLSVFDPPVKAPSFVKATVSIEPKKLLAFLKENQKYMTKKGYFMFSLLEARQGGMYLRLDTYAQDTPEPPQHDRTPDPHKTYATPSGIGEYPAEEVNPEDIPF